jgi:hypothetical protein
MVWIIRRLFYYIIANYNNMSKSLIRKNQLHPDISDLVSGYGTGFFVTPAQLDNAIDISQQIITQGAVLVSGNQTISGLKNFTVLPTISGIPFSTGVGSEYVFPSNLTVNLTPGKTFGRYQNGDTIEASGLTTSQVIQLAITEKINPSVTLSITSPSTSSFLLGQTNISTILSRNYTINNAGASISSASLEWKRGDQSVWNVLDTATTPTPFPHTFTNTVSNSNSINYRYIVTDSQGSIATGTANVSFLYGNYFGYSSATSLTTVTGIEALGNEFLSNGKSRTIVATTPNNQSFTYYAYNSIAGNLTSIIQNGAAPVLGAFQNQGIISGPNKNGVNVSYIVYKSVDPGAFSSDTLAFS